MVPPVGNTPKPQNVEPSKEGGGLDKETKSKIEEGLKDAGLKPEQIEQIMKALEEKLAGGGGQPKTGGGGGGGSPKTGGGEQDPMKMLEQLLQSMGIPPEQIQQIMQQLKGGSEDGGQFPGGPTTTEEQPA